MKFHLRLYCRLALALLLLVLVVNLPLLLSTNRKPSQKIEDLQWTQIGKKQSHEVKQNVFHVFLPSSEDHTQKQADTNNHQYKFINNPKDICTNKSIDLLVAIESAVINFDLRRLARHARHTPPVGIIYLFFLGKSFHLMSLQQRVDREAREFGDIVQEDFEDAPQNLTLKSVSILKWVRDHCAHVRFVIKKIDDFRINLLGILHAFHYKEEFYDHFILGNVKHVTEGFVRRELIKHYKSSQEHKTVPFHTYIEGPMYGFPGRTAPVLYEACLKSQLFVMEDVYVTGICAHGANVPVFFDHNFIYKYNLRDVYIGTRLNKE